MQAWAESKNTSVEVLFVSQIICKPGYVALVICAYIVYNVGMSKIQYTIRSVPLQLDQVLKKRAKQSGKSFNQTVIETLSQETFGSPNPPKTADSFDWLFGAGKLDEAFYEAIAEMSKPDPELWQ